MINGQREIWISTGNKSNYSPTIIAVSNCGRIMRKNGKIEIASYGQQVFVGEKRLQMYVYRFLANNFITKTEEDILRQRACIDHITHEPTSMYINDIRNLRWCTHKENMNFEEAKLNKSKAKIGEKHPMYGKKLSAEHRAKICKAQKGKKHSDETKAKMSKAKIGEKNHMYGKKLSEEHRANLSAAIKRLHWYNDGITNIRANECPPGFTHGRIIKKKSS
jgi:hypothetical protein